ncbi:MAG: glycosyltransferase family 2 protein [Gemmatimonadetes bacterium]|nr:glycosyltransferase family 2 protein [Gemmatimonadota bacterium]
MGVEHALTPSQDALITVYFALWSVFGLLGLRRIWLLVLARRGRRREFAHREPAELPHVTIQLPVYNERYVVERLIRAAADIDYPREKLEIQVLDDSNDATVGVAAAEVARLAATGLDIRHVRRGDRTGYKAGALAHGLRDAKGELVLIFDADFVPRRDLLRRMVPYFSDPGVGMVQVRWDHLNADFSMLARIQAISLDGHFVLEHEARSKNGLFWNFNGTAGMWRRRCIEEAGGWQHDTLTEDLDLSYRAQLAGWRFVYLRDVTCPSELPVDMRAYKGQQFRWVKGSVQVAKKILPRIWRSSLSTFDKIECSVHLTQNVAYLFVLALSIFVYPAVLVRFASGWFTTWPVETLLFSLATISVFVFYGAAVAEVRRDWRRQVGYLPAVMSVAIGLSVNNTRAILEGLFGVESPFHRTPKYAIDGARGTWRDKAYRGLGSGTTLFEILLGLYFLGVLVFTLKNGLFGAAPFVVLFLFGYLYVGLLSLELPRRASASLGAPRTDA